MSDRTISPETKALIKAREFLSNKNNWCPEGEGEHGVNGHKKCAVAALRDVGQIELGFRLKALRLLADAAGHEHEHYSCLFIVEVNAQGHEAVLTMYDKAIRLSMMA